MKKVLLDENDLACCIYKLSSFYKDFFHYFEKNWTLLPKNNIGQNFGIVNVQIFNKY